MTIKTWKAESYPVDEVSESQALAHSLHKWAGLRKEQQDE